MHLQPVGYDIEAGAFQRIASDGTRTAVAVEGGVDDAAVLAVIRAGIPTARDNLNKLNAAIGAELAGGASASGTATAGQNRIVMGQTVGAGKEWQLTLAIGGALQQPGVDFTCDGTATLTLNGAGMSLGEKWWVSHLRGPTT